MEWTVKLEARTGWGETRTYEIGKLARRVVGLAAGEIGLLLEEAKVLLAELQHCVVRSQIDEQVARARVCGDCLGVRQVRDRRTRTLQTLFGTMTVDAPRLRLCACVNTQGLENLSFSPLSKLLPDRCTPELRRLQGELGARHSFREASRLLETLLPCSPPNHASVRNRLHQVAAELDAEDGATGQIDLSTTLDFREDPEIVVLIDGAHIRATPDHQARHLDVTVGKVESPDRSPRRFAMAPRGADRPLTHLRAALAAQGWQPGAAVTVISDGEAALPELIRAATGGAVVHILDWWHISMRVRHAEQAMRGIFALQPEHRAGLDIVDYRISRIRHLLWNGYHEEARRELFGLRHLAGEAVYLNGERLRRSVDRFLWHCDELRGYLANNEAALIDYGSRYREDMPISSSRAEGCVDETANARMAKSRRMRWSPRGAHRVALVRAAVLDGRLGHNTSFRAAA